MYSPCRRVGLKRKSTGTLTPKTVLKKLKVSDETSKSIEFGETKRQNIKGIEKSISKFDYEDERSSNSIDKHHVIEELKSELKNSEQVGQLSIDH